MIYDITHDLVDDAHMISNRFADAI